MPSDDRQSALNRKLKDGDVDDYYGNGFLWAREAIVPFNFIADQAGPGHRGLALRFNSHNMGRNLLASSFQALSQHVNVVSACGLPRATVLTKWSGRPHRSVVSRTPGQSSGGFLTSRMRQRYHPNFVRRLGLRQATFWGATAVSGPNYFLNVAR